jgi:hypothetical protein
MFIASAIIAGLGDVAEGAPAAAAGRPLCDLARSARSWQDVQ